MNHSARLAVLAWTLTLAPVWAAGLTPYGLECEARTNPASIDAEHLRLGWKLRAAKPDQTQTAYQIAVATSAAKLDAADVWDSGRVASSASAWIAYAGPALHPFQRYWWRVRVWDAANAPSAWSEPAEWTAALVAGNGRRGAWIAHPDTSLRTGPLPLFRKEFSIDRPLRQAIVLVTGAGSHELRINGAAASGHVLSPAWTNYRTTTLYEALDVTALLHPGANALGVTVGNSFYNVAGGRYVKYTGSFGQPRLWLQLHLTYADGTSADVVTDRTWKVQDGPVIFSSIYGGEDYDARLEPAGWDRPGFDDSKWQQPSSINPPGGTQRAQSSPPLRVKETFRTVKTTEPRPGVRVYDLGQNFAGWPKIAVSGPAGAQVKLIPGELLGKDGLVSQRSSGGPVSFTYTLKGADRETWSPRFTYYGFRYVQVETTATVHSVEGEFVHLDAPRTGTFSCSNELINRIHKLIDAAVRSNLQHVLTDCPHREKLGWLEQSYLMGPSLLYNWDLRTFLPKIVRDMREAQTVDGLVPDIAPEYVTFSRGFRDSPEWGAAAAFIPWLDYQWYGDRDSLAYSYRMMKLYAGYLETKAKDGILTHGLGDWYDIGPKGPGVSQLTPQGVTATATYWSVLHTLERTARALGLPGEAATHAAHAARILAAFQRAYYKAEGPTYATGSQTSLAMPLALGMAPAAARKALTDQLVADIRSHGNHTTAGDVGYTYVVAALTAAGRSDVLFDLATQTAPPSYAGQLANGATSLTEAWDTNPSSSQNHLMLGHIEQWFWAGLAGIRPDAEKPGLTHLVIQPEPVGDVTWVKAGLETFRGPVTVDWRIEGGTFRLTVDLPPGITAEVRPPHSAPVQTGSGRHEFTVKNFAR
jgi:alpha-L-rhamnosidase